MSTEPSMFDSDSADIPIAVEVKQGVLIQVPGLSNFRGPELDVKGVCAPEVLDLHNVVKRPSSHFLKET